MSRISIKFDERTSNAHNTPVPVEVFEIFDERLVRVAEKIVYLPYRTDVDVSKPGMYHVRAELPTGESVATTVQVETSTSEVSATLVATEGSPLQSLAWAYVLQGVRQASGMVSTERRDMNVRVEAATDVALGPSPNLTITDTYRMKADAAGWRMSQVRERHLEASEDRSVHLNDARLIMTYSIKYRAWRGRPQPEDWFPTYVRWSVRATPEAPEEIGFVAVPMSYHHRAMLLFVRADARSGSPIQTLVTGVRHDAEALLAYLEHGAYRASRLVGEEVTRRAIDVLQQKKDDPFAACIAGYFLLRTRQLEQQQWMQNLADWFPAIPDGAVIYGMCLLRGEARNVNRQEGRRYLLEAVKRGIPVYTAGLRLLFDGLQLLANDGKTDDDVLLAIARIRYIAAFADWEAQTTSFSIPPNTTDLPFL